MEQWRALRSEWNQLLQESDASSFFLTWEWLYSWAQVCLNNDRRLFVVALYDKSKLVGVAPLYIGKNRVGFFNIRELRFLSTPESGADYLDVICAKGYEKKAADRLFHYLHHEANHQWDQLTLTDMRSDSLFLIHFETVIEQTGKSSTFAGSDYCPVLTLPATEEALYAGLSPGWRKKFKQDLRVAQRDYHIEHQQISNINNSKELDAFFLHYREKAGRPEQPIRDIVHQFINQLSDQSPIRLDVLHADGLLVAGLLHIEYQNTLYMYLMTVDKEYNDKISFGNILVGLVLINALNTKCRFYDFLKGTERYKFHWANGGFRTVTFQFRQRRFRTICLSFLETHKQLAKLILR